MMKETVLSRSIRLLCASGLLIGMQVAYADEATEKMQRVEVTGSHIATPGADSASPLQVITAADIQQSGVVNIQDLLQKNPVTSEPTLSRTNSNFLTSGGGVSTIDLRQLGTSRTLVLVNGRRYVAGVPGDTAVDLNTIPTDFIERIELMTGGASATYGSDAVAGVVNIILKRNFQGLALDASAGQSYKHDDTQKKFSMTWGTSSADGASNVMAHFGISQQGAVYSRDRDISAVDQYSKMAASTGDPADAFTPIRPFYSSYAPQGRFFHDTGSFTYDKDGNITSWSTNGTATKAATGFNRSDYRTIAVPTDRILLATSGNLALNENHSAFFEGTYASTKTDTKIEPFPLGSDSIYPATGGQVPAEFLVNGALVKNPLVPQYLFDRISDTDGDGLRDYFFTRRLAEVGSRTAHADRDTFRLLTGLKGNVFNWNYEVYAAYGKTKEAQTSNGQVNVLNFRNALEAIPDPNNPGQAICRDANAVAQGCVPINVWGLNSISPQALAYVTAPGSLATAVTQKLLGGTISGDLYQLPAGPLGIAAGFEYRHEDSSSVPDVLTQQGLNAGNALPATYGNFGVKEAFVEARVPLLKDKPFAKELTFLGTVRNGDYTTVGHTLSWNGGLEWKPVNDLKFRATRALSTRAPNINELFQGPQQTFPSGIQDPCQGVTATSTGAKDDACRKNPGVMANIAANGTFTLNQADAQGISGYDSGNPNLKEEKGHSWTAGIIFSPSTIPVLNKFTFTADYFNIDIRDAIVSTPRQFILDQCYGGDASFCQFVTRRAAPTGANSAGSISYLNSGSTNSGGEATEGVDVTVSYSDKVGPGKLNAHASWTYTGKGYTIPLPGADPTKWAGTIGSPKNRANLHLNYKWGNFGVTSSTSFIGESRLDDEFLASFDLPPGAVKVGSKVYNDFQFTYTPSKRYELYFGINNAFNTKPAPIISGLPGNDTGTETNAGTYDPIGRRYYLGVRMSM
jgi:iron complex outermembrane recepter protein